VPEKAIISHRGEKYEIGRGKRFYGIWVVGAPYDAPVDRWPENRDGWEQAWRRFVSIEKPETIAAVQSSRSGLRLFNRGTDAPAPAAPGTPAPGAPEPAGLIPDDGADDLISFGGAEDDFGGAKNDAVEAGAEIAGAETGRAETSRAETSRAETDSAETDSAETDSAEVGSADASGIAASVPSKDASTPATPSDAAAPAAPSAAASPASPALPAAGGTPRGPVPVGPRFAMPVPAGTAPTGSVPAGTVPAGTVPAGTVPTGTVLAGTVAGGTVPGGDARRPGTALLAAEGMLVFGVVLGLGGLFPAYVGGQSLLSQGDQVVPHLLYVVGWAVSAALIALGFARSGTARLGALFGLGLSAVTFGFFVADLGEVIQGGATLGTGLIVSLLGWLACTAGSALTLGVVGRGEPADAPAADSVPAGTEPGFPQPAYGQQGYRQPGYAPGYAQPGYAQPGYSQPGYAYPGYGQPGYGQPGYHAQPGYGQPGYAQPGYGRTGFATRARHGIAGRSWLAWPSRWELGPFGLLLLAGIGTVAAFAPSWDSYTLTTASGTSQTITAGNAFSNPGWVIFGNVAVMVAVVLVAALAALWRPPRLGALLLAGAIVPLAGQAVSALIQVSHPASASMFGISQAQASAIGLTITSGITSIFWVYCVFVISLLVSCAWLMTAPTRPAMPPILGMPWSPVPHGDDAHADAGGADPGDDTDSEGGAEGGGQSAYA